MSTPRSLPISSTSQPFVNTKRSSGSSQLPLPPSLNADSAQKSYITNQTQSRSPSSPTANISFSRGDTSPGTSHQSQLSPQFSSTHAGGIQPSASFFRPSRPSQQYSRPSSEVSSSGRAANDIAETAESDVFHLTPLVKIQSRNSDDHSGSLDDHREFSVDQPYQFSRKRSKKGREPLLPIGSGPSTPVRPTMMRGISELSSGGTPAQNTPTTPVRRMRTSLEKVFSLKRGMSLDSIRHSSSTRNLASEDGPSTYEGKLGDEEYGTPMFPPSPHNRYKNSSSPLPHAFPQSLNTNTFRHSQVHSPDPSYNPTHPPGIPRAFTPIIDPTSKKPLRNFQQHPSRNRFFLNGRFLTGGDSPWAFIGCLTTFFSISTVWFATTSVWWWRNVSPAVPIIGAYMSLLVISCMLATAFRDPGILPRNLDLDPPYPTSSPSDGGVRAPMPRDLKVRTDVVRVKYCPTCKTYRPPRSSHCKMCDNCVDGCDHHCQWVNNCVGRRNYTTFFTLLFTATLTLILVICTSALHLYFLVRRNHVSFKEALRTGAGSAVVFCLSIAIIWPVAALLTYHMRLLLLNVTTIEQIRNQAHKSLVPGPAPPNPFSHGNWRRNLVTILCRPVAPSWVNPNGIATEDKREPNPGYVDG